MSSPSSMPPAEAAIAPPTASDAPPASASAAQPSPPSIVVAPPPPPPAIDTAAPPLNNDDDAPLKEESAPQENAPPSKEVAAPPAVAASSSSDGDTGGVDTTIVTVAPQSSHGDSSNDMVQPPPTPSLQQRSRRSTANYDQDYSSEGIFTTEEGEEAAFAEGGEEVESSQHHDNRSFNFSDALTEHHDGIIILSMKDPNYKAIMFSSFQKLGAVPKHERDEDEEERVKEEVFHLLKKSGGGRFMNYVNFRFPKEGVVEVDEMAARKKIFNYIDRRLESKAHWAKEEAGAGAKDISVSAATPRESSISAPRENRPCSTSTSTPNNPVMMEENDTPPIILSLKDANYRQVMFAAFQKLGALATSDRDYNEERRVKDEMYNLFKSTGRKMVIYLNRNVKDGLIEVDEKAARDKINMDISRRMESQTRWDGVDLATDMSLLFQGKEAAVDEEEETILGSDDDDGSDYEDDSNSSLPVQGSGNDAILSMKNANYKAIMFSFFRQLKAHAVHERDRNEEKRVKNEAFALLKSLGGRMMKYRNRMKPADGIVEVDEKTARLQIGNDISKRLSSYSDWATEGTFNPHRDGASKKQPAGPGRSSHPRGDKLVSIRKSATKYSPPTKRVSSYPRRSRNRVTFKDDVQFSMQKTQVAKRVRSSASARLSELHSQIDQKVLDTESSLVDDVATTETRSSSRDYKCRICGQPKKGHKCTGNPPSWEEESSTEVVHTPVRPLSKSQARRSAMSPKFITPTQDSVVVTSARGRRKRQSGCGECENCQREDCGRCASCKDKVKFGGRGTKRQKCKEKRCLANESLPAQTTNVDNSQFTTPTTSRSSTKRKSAVAANLTIMNVMADEDLENKGPSGEYMIGSDDLVESDLLVKRAKFDSVEEQMPSFEEISASEFNDLIDLLQSSPLPQRKMDTEVDWQGLHLADLSPIPVIPATRVVKLDTTKPIILGPNSAWSQRLIMTEEVTTTPSFRMPKPRTFKSNLREPEPKTSDSQQFESIMSPPNFSRDDYTSIFSEPEDPKLIPYSPIKLLPRPRKSSL